MGHPAPAPDRIGKYEVRRILGKGAMGVVYLAYDPDLRREVALKTMTGLLADGDEEGTGRFYREARSAGSLHHRRIVTVYELGEAEGIPYIAMEALKGRDLSSIVKQDGPLAPRRALEIVAQIAEGLEFAHRSGVVHRDVKPANIFIDEKGEVTLVDFGIAKMADNELTRTGVLVGSVDYMSPEQVRGTPPLDGRADLWSAVVILYELLFQRKPFSTRDTEATAVMFRIVQALPLGAARMARLLPRRLARLILRGLEKNRDHRFPDGATLAAAVRRVLDEEPDLDGKVADVCEQIVGSGDLDDDDEATATEIATIIDTPLPPVRRRGLRRGLLAAGLVLTVTVAATAWWWATRPPDVPLPAAPVAAPGSLALSTVPWASLTSLRDLSTDEAVTLPGGGPLPTPLHLDLPAGRYRARLENSALAEPLEIDVVVRTGEVTLRTDLRLPGFDAEAAIEQLIAVSLPAEDAP